MRKMLSIARDMPRLTSILLGIIALMSSPALADDHCDSHDQCYKLFSINNYCCRDSCCNWFKFVYKYMREIDEVDELDMKRPSAVTIVLIALASFALITCLCCVCVVYCFCKKCCFFKKKHGAHSRSKRRGEVLMNPRHTNRAYAAPFVNLSGVNEPHVNRAVPYPAAGAQVVLPPVPTAPANTHNQFYFTQEHLNQVLPSAPLLSNVVEPSAPDFDLDHPPAYEDLVKAGEVIVVAK